MNGGLISPSETKHQTSAEIRWTNSSKWGSNQCNGFTSGLLIIKDVKNNLSNIFINFL